ncbi:MAG TPA: phage tail sheath C-terminal domain-containing protein [Malonomonas sp.]
MATYKTPDVYVEEISLFPPSVAEVETAVPAFIGYTERADKNGESLHMKPTPVRSMIEFLRYFGGGPPITPTVKLKDDNSVAEVELGGNSFFLYDSMRIYFDNGGGKCYLVSVGDYSAPPSIGNDTSGILGGLKLLEKEDEPTMLLCPDATLLGSTNLYQFQQQALAQCGKLMDRVTICDLKDTGDIDADKAAFRNNIGIKNLKYGASYMPWLKTSYTKQIKSRNVTLQRASTGGALKLENLTKDAALKSFITGELNAAILAATSLQTNLIDAFTTGDNKTLKEQFGQLDDSFKAAQPYATVDAFQIPVRGMYSLVLDVLHAMLTSYRTSLVETEDFKLRTDLDTIVKNNQLQKDLQLLLEHHNSTVGFTAGKIFVTSGAPGTRLTETIAALNSITGSALTDALTDPDVNDRYDDAANANAKANIALEAAIMAFGGLSAALAELAASAADYESTFDGLLVERFATYKNIVNGINDKLSTLPPSGAVAGAYAFTDRTRGVWKAPANISLSSVNGPTVKIDAKEQEDLNVDVNAGKSINAIRPFSGKGTLIWGARTLAGNDNEWRYISVRRFFNMVEESVKKSTYWAVFEPNDANTWIKLKAMIENYLVQKWRDGALQGVKPEHAFFVRVGLGETMTAQDILEGRMNVEIGMAVVRPAEFIILKFSHKMMES